MNLRSSIFAATLLAASSAAIAQAGSAAGAAASQAATPDLAASIASDPFHKLDRNHDGYISKDEATGKLRANWARFDTNGDGKIDSAEFAAGANQASIRRYSTMLRVWGAVRSCVAAVAARMSSA